MREEVLGSTRREEAGGAGLDPGWTLADYSREFGETIDVELFSAMAVDCVNLVMYDRSNFQCDTVLGALKRH